MLAIKVLKYWKRLITLNNRMDMGWKGSNTFKVIKVIKHM
jgi:hypothetical protein